VAARDPYDVLGVARDASEDDIRKAFRRHAKTWHPDRNPGDPKAEARFKELNAAYGVLGDPERRARFDRGEIDADGNERAPFGFAGGRGRTAGAGAAGGGFAGADVEDILSSIFGAGRGRRGGFDFDFSAFRGGAGAAGAEAPPSPDVETTVGVPFLDAVKGGTVRVRTPDGRTLDVKVPPGTPEGQVVRLRGQGRPAEGRGGKAGDLLVKLWIEPHATFRREGDDIAADLPVTLGEAVLGGRVQVPTVDGPVAMTIPAGSNSGRLMRLRGKGVPKADGTRGDQFVRLVVTLPDGPDPELEAFVRGWAPKRPYDPRSSG
jgi:DnaJ-class molecular chaperone